MFILLYFWEVFWGWLVFDILFRELNDYMNDLIILIASDITENENVEALVVATKEIGLEVNADKINENRLQG